MPGPFLGFHNVDEANTAPVADVAEGFAHAPGVNLRPTDIHPLRVFTDDGTKLVRKALIVRKPNGMTVSWHGTEPIPSDHVIVSGDDDGSHVDELARIDRGAYELRPVPYATGRRYILDGEIVTEVVDDFSVWKPVPR